MQLEAQNLNMACMVQEEFHVQQYCTSHLNAPGLQTGSNDH